MSKTIDKLVSSALISSLVFMLATICLAQTQENAEVAKLLSQARDQAAVLSRDADEMESLTRSQTSWETHADVLNRVKDNVNTLAGITEKLQQSRNSASPWQQQAIDRMLPLLRDLASNTTAAINHLNQNKSRPTTADYTEYLKANDETAHELADTISNFVQYGQTRAKMQKLEQRLEIATR
jgi:hypothetical protein